MARNFSDMVDDAIRKKIASFKVGYGDEWVKYFLEWAEPSTGDGCPKCGGAPSRYYFGCDTPGCDNYNDGSRVNPALKAKIDASINYD